MKYSESLPKISYETTIGSFNVVDISSYYKINPDNIQRNTINVDKSSTLVETASTVYNDTNSFWLFLIANNTINPFTLTKFNSTTQIQDYANSDTIIATYNSVKIYSPAGSIIAKYASTGGSAWQYSSVGNFSLTGGFALVDTYNPYSKRLIMKDPQGITFSTYPNVWNVVNGTTGYYTAGGSTLPVVITNYTIQSETTKQLTYATGETQAPYIDVDSEQPVVAGPTGGYYPAGTVYDDISYTDSASQQSIAIAAFLPYSSGYQTFKLIKQSYIV